MKKIKHFRCKVRQDWDEEVSYIGVDVTAYDAISAKKLARRCARRFLEPGTFKVTEVVINKNVEFDEAGNYVIPELWHADKPGENFRGTDPIEVGPERINSVNYCWRG